ncbi:hypothetical protein TruAng_006236 [Truncatella angustata]|nr:hypothetical protein TruAng_006236 [Truncatella angustata]
MAPKSMQLLSAVLLACLCLSGAQAHHTVKKTLTVTYKKGAPDGIQRDVIYINGQFPGPDLVFDEGDDVEITVKNNMPFNTTMHWHGLLMQGTPWSDGVPGLTQKPIEPGEDFIYRFKAEPAGTYWYHSHSRATLLDGMYGPLWIRPKSDAATPYKLISSDKKELIAIEKAARDPELLTVSDWSNFTSWEYMNGMVASGLDIFCVDSILLNGKGESYCPGQPFLQSEVMSYMQWALGEPVNDKGCFPFVYSTEGPFLPGKPEAIPDHMWKDCIPAKGENATISVDAKDGWASLNIVMASTMKAVVFSIDEHDLWLYEVDGHFVQPAKYQWIVLLPAKRYNVLVKLDKTPGDYTIRIPDQGFSQIISGFATLSYKHGKSLGPTTPWITYGGLNASTEGVGFAYSDTLPPYPPIKPAAKSDVAHVFYLYRWDQAYTWTLGGSAVMPVDAWAYKPLLYNPLSEAANDTTLVVQTKFGQWVDLIIQVGSKAGEEQEINHVIHKHASKAWQVGAGSGVWNFTSVDQAVQLHPELFNFENPPYMDVFLTSFEGPSWIIMRYQVDNPGPWLIHCHSEIHVAGGMAMVIMDGVDKWPKIPNGYGPDQKGHF